MVSLLRCVSATFLVIVVISCETATVEPDNGGYYRAGCCLVIKVPPGLIVDSTSVRQRLPEGEKPLARLIADQSDSLTPFSVNTNIGVSDLYGYQLKTLQSLRVQAIAVDSLLLEDPDLLEQGELKITGGEAVWYSTAFSLRGAHLVFIQAFLRFGDATFSVSTFMDSTSYEILKHLTLDFMTNMRYQSPD